MSGIRQSTFPSRYIINTEEAGQDKYWSTNTTYDKLLLAYGQHIKDYADITYIAEQLMWNTYGNTLSDEMAPIYDYVQGSGGVEIIDKNFIRYRVYGEPERRAMSVSNVNQNDFIGQGGFPFKFVSDVDWWRAGQVLSPVNNKRIQIVLQDDGFPAPGGTEYEAVLLDEDYDAYIPSQYFNYGQYWISMGSVTSWQKYSGKGTIQFGESFSYLEFEVPLSTMEWTFEVDGEAHRQFGNVSITRADNEGRPMPEGTKITNYLEMRARAQVKRETDLMNAWGSKTEHLIDKNTSKQITTAPGYYEYMEQGNVIPYMPGPDAIDYMMEQLEAAWFDRIPESQREVLFFTGTPGLKQFSEWVEARFGSTAAIYHYDFVLKKRVPFDQANDREGFAFVRPQFVEYHLPLFGKITVAHWKALDNTRENGVRFPGTIYPARSYEYIAFDIGFGRSNLKFFERVDNKIDTILPGLWSPFGATGADNPVFKTPAYLDESYKWIHRKSFGAVLMRPEASLWFKPAIDY